MKTDRVCSITLERLRRLPFRAKQSRVRRADLELSPPTMLHHRGDEQASHAQRRTRNWLRQRRRLFFGSVLLLAGLCLSVVGGRLVVRELVTSERQARYLTELGQQLTFHLAPGPSPAVHFPTGGPYNDRLGYTRLPAFLDRLLADKYRFEAQARLSPRLRQLHDWGVFPIYHEKTQAGLRILDGHGDPLYAAQYPERLYTTFEELPELLVHTLLFIENRELLDARYPYRNPAVEWDRFGKALLDKAIHVVKRDHHVAGGSTLATQLEKFRHSPEGRTTAALEKLRQMVSASLRAYQQGAETLAVRRQIILDYINTMPLAALPGYGEVHGLGDGLWAWYNVELSHVQRLLAGPEAGTNTDDLAARALAYKQVLSLFMAQRRPSFYLPRNAEALTAQTDAYLRLLSQEGLISPTLRNAAIRAQLQVRQAAAPEGRVSFLERKGANAIRTNLLTLLRAPGLYDLDRFDLTVYSTLDRRSQEAITGVLHRLQEPAYAEAMGLRGPYLLARDDNPRQILYSVTLYERAPQANVLRLQTDNFDQPFDVNRGMRLDLGSTAKLRTLITYLECIARLHSEYASLSRRALRAVRVHPSDRLAAWAVMYLTHAVDLSLPRMLEAALERRYSASPAEQFLTGGGRHTFANFNSEDDAKVLSVREALRHSVNLVFIRLMRDIVRYCTFHLPGSAAAVLLGEDRHPQRQVYLLRFAEQEGQAFVQRFYREYAGKSPEDILERLLDGVHPTPERFAAVYGAVEPEATFEMFTAFMQQYFLASHLTHAALRSLYTRHVAATFTLADRGYLTRVHPLELWVATYLRHHPHARHNDTIVASAGTRQEVYRWLAKTQSKQAQDQRIRTLLEAEAFLEIHQAWQRLGYPFAALVPSYATAIGSSGDRPDALAELMGILVQDGMRYPTVSIQRLHFAADTPYETIIGLAPRGERVLAPEIAAVVKRVLLEVVEQGTAKRVYGAFRRSDGSVMPVGGKTGTGDHRYKRFGAGGQLLTARVINRTATFVFMIDERFFGVVTAYVPGSEAAQYGFTSSLPVQVLKNLAPTLQSLVNTPQTPTVEASTSGPVSRRILPGRW
jgi:membrane peptidoglycan carboxypeptidase